jgi:SAM-dependent methyltransferase
MGVLEFLKKKRRVLEKDLLNKSIRNLFSPFFYGQYKITLPIIKKYIHGNLIDLGCGDMPYRVELLPLVQEYHGLDFFPRSDDITYIGDIQNMTGVPSGMYDSAICLEVLEHVPDPLSAAKETFRILTPGGYFILTVPHLSRLHDLPHDYYRYTRYGLEYILKSSGFEIIEILARQGLFSFLGHQGALLVLGSVWGIPILSRVIYYGNALFNTSFCYHLDKWLKLDRLFPLGYTVVARKPEALASV